MPRFRAVHTQVLGVSIDSIYSHASWGRDLGGVSFPLLSDFEPKGAVARSYGAYLEGAGITDRATVIIDSSGVVRYAASVTPAGQRDLEELGEECERVDREASSKTSNIAPAAGLPGPAVLYVKSACGASRAALVARDNLHLTGSVDVKNVTEDATAKEHLVAAGGKDQAPCLVVGDQAFYESAEIIQQLAEAAAPV